MLAKAQSVALTRSETLPLVEKLEKLIAQSSWGDAKKLIQNIFNVYLKDMPAAERCRIFKALHPLTQHFIKTTASCAEVNALYDVVIKNGYLLVLTTEEQAGFFLAAGDVYLQGGSLCKKPWLMTGSFWQQASDFYTCGLVTGHAEQLFLIRIQIIEKVALMQLRLDYFSQAVSITDNKQDEKQISITQLSPDKQLTLFISHWQLLIPLLEQLKQTQQLFLLPAIYQQLTVWFNVFLEDLDIVLNQVKNQGVEQFIKTINKIQPLAETWLADEQIKIAQNICDCISKHAKNLREFKMPWFADFLSRAFVTNDEKPSNNIVIPTKVDAFTNLSPYRKELLIYQQSLRQNLQEDKVDVLLSQQKYSQQIRNLLKDILQSCEQLLGNPPGEFAVLAVGSLAREDFNLVSDLDLVLLVEREELRAHDYFQALLEILRIKLASLGDLYFKIDSGDLAHFQKNGDLIATPKTLISLYDPKIIKANQVEPYAAHRPVLLYGSTKGQALLTSYQESLLEKLELFKIPKDEKDAKQSRPTLLPPPQSICHQDLGKRYLIEHARALVENREKKTTTISLKERYLTPLILWCNDIALYAGITAKNNAGLEVSLQTLLDIFVTQKILTESFVIELRAALGDLQRFRNLAVLSVKQQERLAQIDRLVLQPSYQAITAWTDPTATQSAVWPLEPSHHNVITLTTLQQPLEILFNVTNIPTKLILQLIVSYLTQHDPLCASQQLPVLAETLVQRCLTVQEHVKYFQHIPEFYRRSYMDHLRILLQEPHAAMVMELLERYPSNGKKRVGWEQATIAWTHMIAAQMMTPIQQEAKNIQRAYIQWWNAEGKRETRYLQPHIQKQLFHDNGALREEKRNRENSQRLVVPVYKQHDAKEEAPIAWCKFFPQMPGMQIISAALGYQISGYSLRCQLVKMFPPNSSIGYPVLISKPVGISLKEIGKNDLQQHKSLLQEVQNQLDLRSFTLKFLESVIVNYEDDQAGNLTAEPIITDSKGTVRYRLVGIDSDHAFQSALTAGGYFQKAEINIKNILYCMDAMCVPLDKQAVLEFLALDAHHVAKQVLMTAIDYEDRHIQDEQGQDKGLFTRKEVVDYFQTGIKGQTAEDKCILPPELQTGAIAQFFLRIQALQLMLSKCLQRLPTPLNILQRFEPELALRYGPLLQEKQLNPILRMQRLLKLKETKLTELKTALSSTQASANWTMTSKLNVEQALSCSASKMVTYSKHNNEQYLQNYSKVIKWKNWSDELARMLLYYHDHSKFKLLCDAVEQGQLEDFITLGRISTAQVLIEKIINNISFKRMAENINNPKKTHDLQTQLLEIIAGYNFTKLNLSQCQALTNAWLKTIINKEPSYLRSLNVNGCEQLTDQAVRYIAYYCPNLERLNLSNLTKVERITEINNWGLITPLSFLKLRRLSLNNCMDLMELNIQAPQLEILQLAGCVRFEDAWKKHALAIRPASENLILVIIYLEKEWALVDKNILKEAEQGDARCQNLLGCYYGSDRAVQPSYSQAVFWYHKAAKQGHPSAQFNLGVCYTTGQGVEKDEKQAAFWYHKAAEQGHTSRQHNIKKSQELWSNLSDAKAVACLLCEEANPDYVNSGISWNNWSCLAWAVYKKRADIVALLLEAKATPNQFMPGEGKTLLNFAIYQCNPEPLRDTSWFSTNFEISNEVNQAYYTIAECLLNHGANPDDPYTVVQHCVKLLPLFLAKGGNLMVEHVIELNGIGIKTVEKENIATEDNPPYYKAGDVLHRWTENYSYLSLPQAASIVAVILQHGGNPNPPFSKVISKCLDTPEEIKKAKRDSLEKSLYESWQNIAIALINSRRFDVDLLFSQSLNSDFIINTIRKHEPILFTAMEKKFPIIKSTIISIAALLPDSKSTNVPMGSNPHILLAATATSINQQTPSPSASTTNASATASMHTTNSMKLNHP